MASGQIGCGRGRFVVTAARSFHCSSAGVDLPRCREVDFRFSLSFHLVSAVDSEYLGLGVDWRIVVNIFLPISVAASNTILHGISISIKMHNRIGL